MPKDPPTLLRWARGKKEKKKDVIRRWTIVKGDKVAVVNGNCEGQRGVIQKVFRDKNLVIVEGVNVRRRLVDDEANPNGDRIPKDVPCVIHYSNVNLICPLTDLPTRVRHRYVNGKRTRFAARSGAEIPKPEIKIDKVPELVGDYDTDPDDVLTVTYDPLHDRNAWVGGFQHRRSLHRVPIL